VPVNYGQLATLEIEINLQPEEPEKATIEVAFFMFLTPMTGRLYR
jgi:hypothetical protein